MLAWLGRLRVWRDGWRGPQAGDIPEGLWQETLSSLPFLQQLHAHEQLRLRELCAGFLRSKEFHGAQGLVVTDAMALSIAAQACLPVLGLGLQAYDHFVGIVVQPDAVLARREVHDAAGVVHHFNEPVLGEAMTNGPVMVSWPEVAQAGALAQHGRNLVIHEFVHQFDSRDGEANGCPPLPAGFMGHATARSATAAWAAALRPAWDRFKQATVMAERFGAEPTWLDPYGATSPAEFLAVACEAYFVNRERFAQDFADLMPVFDACFRPQAPAQ